LAGELGYQGAKTIFDDYVREVRPRFRVRRTFHRTIYRLGELVQGLRAFQRPVRAWPTPMDAGRPR